jgi:arginine exporter protein ArgO
VIAGYGIAIPVGAVAVLIIDLGLRRGFRSAFMAGAGAATADGFYAAVAAFIGVVIAAALEPASGFFETVGGITLVVIAAVGILRVTRRSGNPRPKIAPTGHTYVAFVGLTLLNPTTVVYFSALILGLQSQTLRSPVARTAFVVGAFVASLSWQTFLAAGSSIARHRLSDRAALATGWLGNLIVAALGVRLLLG